MHKYTRLYQSFEAIRCVSQHEPWEAAASSYLLIFDKTFSGWFGALRVNPGMKNAFVVTHVPRKHARVSRRALESSIFKFLSCGSSVLASSLLKRHVWGLNHRIIEFHHGFSLRWSGRSNRQWNPRLLPPSSSPAPPSHPSSRFFRGWSSHLLIQESYACTLDHRQSHGESVLGVFSHSRTF